MINFAERRGYCDASNCRATLTPSNEIPDMLAFAKAWGWKVIKTVFWCYCGEHAKTAGKRTTPRV